MDGSSSIFAEDRFSHQHGPNPAASAAKGLEHDRDALKKAVRLVVRQFADKHDIEIEPDLLCGFDDLINDIAHDRLVLVEDGLAA